METSFEGLRSPRSWVPRFGSSVRDTTFGDFDGNLVRGSTESSFVGSVVSWSVACDVTLNGLVNLQNERWSVCVMKKASYLKNVTKAG